MSDSKRGYGALDGAQTVVPVLHRSLLNSFETPLGAGESDTGDWEENDAPGFAIAVDSDVAGTGFVDFSLDGGTNFSTFPPAGFALGPGLPPHSGQKYGRWTRVRYTNGATPQTRFKLDTSYGNFNPLNAPLGGNIAADADAQIVRSISADLDLAFGRIGGQIEDGKFGYVDLLDGADTGTDVWAWGSDNVSGAPRKQFPETADTLYAVSDSALDTGLVIKVPYLDATGAEQTVDVTLQGLTRVRITDTGDGLDCNRAFEDGDKAAVGNVYITYGTDTGTGAPNDPNDVLAFIPIEYGQTQQATYRVPAGKKIRIKQNVVTVSRAAGTSQTAARIHLIARLPGKSWLTKRVWNLPVGEYSAPEAGLVFPPLTAIRQHVFNVDESDTNVTGKFIFDLVDT